jgi:hypothetical protein
MHHGCSGITYATRSTDCVPVEAQAVPILPRGCWLSPVGVTSQHPCGGRIKIRAPIHNPDIIHHVDPSCRQIAGSSVAGLAVVEVDLAHVALVQIYETTFRPLPPPLTHPSWRRLDRWSERGVSANCQPCTLYSHEYRVQYSMVSPAAAATHQRRCRWLSPPAPPWRMQRASSSEQRRAVDSGRCCSDARACSRLCRLCGRLLLTGLRPPRYDGLAAHSAGGAADRHARLHGDAVCDV